VEVSWDDSLVNWLLSQQAATHRQSDLERLVDGVLSPRLVQYLPEGATPASKRLRVRWDGSAVQVDATE
jgi:hypothetical protein